MDQAISIMGEAGVAKLVDFNPISTNDVVLPEDAAFVIGTVGLRGYSGGAHAQKVKAHEQHAEDGCPCCRGSQECRIFQVSHQCGINQPD